MQIDNVSVGKRRRISGRLLVTMGGLMLIGSAAAKLAHVPQVVNQLGAMGFDGGRLTHWPLPRTEPARAFSQGLPGAARR